MVMGVTRKWIVYLRENGERTVSAKRSRVTQNGDLVFFLSDRDEACTAFASGTWIRFLEDPRVVVTPDEFEGMSTRLKKVLYRAGVRSVEDINSIHDLDGTRGYGDRCKKELEEFLKTVA